VRRPDETRSYGEHPEQIIDFYYPAAEPTRLVFLIHGGFWRQEHDRAHLVPLAARVAERGAVVAVPEYRRIGGAGGFPQTFDDIAAAVDIIPELNPAQPVVLAGFSAGGHLALWAAARHRLPTGSRWRLADRPNVVGVVALAPVSDLEQTRALALDDNAAGELLGDGGSLDETDPMRLLPTGIPTIVIHGRRDNRVPYEMSERFVKTARAAGDRAELITLDVGHFELIDPAHPAGVQTLNAIYHDWDIA